MKPVQVACIALMFIAMTIAAPAPTLVLASGTAATLALPTVVVGNGTIATTAALLGAKKLLLAGALLAAQS